MAGAITVLDFPAVGSMLDGDILYLLRGGGLDRDKKIDVSDMNTHVMKAAILATGTGSYDLDGQHQDVIAICDAASADITVTFTNKLPNKGKLVVINRSVQYKATIAGTVAGNIPLLPGACITFISDGSDMIWQEKGITTQAAGFQAAIDVTAAALTDIDWATGNIQRLTMDQDISLAFAHPIIGSMILIVTHDTVDRDLTFPEGYQAFIDGPSTDPYTLVGGATKKTMFVILYDGSSYFINNTPYFGVV